LAYGYVVCHWPSSKEMQDSVLLVIMDGGSRDVVAVLLVIMDGGSRDVVAVEKVVGAGGSTEVDALEPEFLLALALLVLLVLLVLLEGGCVELLELELDNGEAGVAGAIVITTVVVSYPSSTLTVATTVGASVVVTV
jgi:hypothetical protein